MPILEMFPERRTGGMRRYTTGSITFLRLIVIVMVFRCRYGNCLLCAVDTVSAAGVQVLPLRLLSFRAVYKH